MAWRTVPICEECFMNEESAIGYGHGGVPYITKHPYQIEASVRQVETCYSCEDNTIVGIYVRREFADEKEDDVPVFGGGVVVEPRAILEGPL